jgi:hypothetical protein
MGGEDIRKDGKGRKERERSPPDHRKNFSAAVNEYRTAGTRTPDAPGQQPCEMTSMAKPR